MGPPGDRVAFLDEHDALLNALASRVECIRRGEDGYWTAIDSRRTGTEDDEEWPMICVQWGAGAASVVGEVNAPRQPAVPGRTSYY